MSNMKLSVEQEEVASHSEGALLVLASAGSGKTRVLTERIKRLADKTKRRILAITFTNKASEEIKERLAEQSDILSKVFVGTFHSFCSSVLEMHGAAIGYQELPQVFSDNEDRLKIIEEVILETPLLLERFNHLSKREKDQFKYKALDVIAKIKRELIMDEELEDIISNDNIILLYYNYREKMESMNAIDFEDLLYLTYKLFINNHNIASLYRRNYEYICIDEAQDLNRAQYMLLRSLTGDAHNNVMLVGDPKQSIYAFNGSSSKFMEHNFKEDYSPKEITLALNYRSSKRILEFANLIVPNSSSASSAALEGGVEVISFKTEEEESKWVTSKIKELLLTREMPDVEGDVNLNRIAILARNKYILLPLEKSLKDNKIKYYYKSTVYGLNLDSDTGKIFNLALQVKVNSKDKLHISQLEKILKLPECDSLDSMKNLVDNNLYFDILDTVIKLDYEGRNFKRSIDNLIAKLELEVNYKDIDENERNIAYIDLKEIKIHWLNYARENLSRSLASFRNAMALGQTYKREKNEGIALSTVHTMKGQENDIVFLIGMDDQTFPDYRAIQKRGIEIEQEKNNLYVAITRAKRYLYITYPTSRKMPWGDVKERVISRFLPDDRKL